MEQFGGGQTSHQVLNLGSTILKLGDMKVTLCPGPARGLFSKKVTFLYRIPVLWASGMISKVWSTMKIPLEILTKFHKV